MITIGWNSKVPAPTQRLERLMSLIAAEAGVAIERAALLDRLERMAHTDDLTGLINRRAWDLELEREVGRARRNDNPLAVAMLDLDRFKAYNDRHGHQAGDRVLREAASAWRTVLRDTDLLARYGGEEFAVALPGCDLEQAGHLRRPASRGDSGRPVLLGRPRRLGRRRVGRRAPRPRRRRPSTRRSRRAGTGPSSRSRPNRLASAAFGCESVLTRASAAATIGGWRPFVRSGPSWCR